MCGIVGIISPKINEQESICLAKAVKALSKRGPDYCATKTFNTIGLGHARLSILDTSSESNQPFEDSSGRYIIVFNGEIYNYKSLKAELISKGSKFRTSGDTEVLLEAYKVFGSSFLNKLNGFFAFAIYDKEEKKTLIARDRFGIKPLLIYQKDNTVLFGSEMKALLSFPISKELDNSSIYTYLQLNYIPEPHSIFKDVKKLEPGHYLIIDENLNITKTPFYQLNYPSDENYSTLSYNKAQDKFISLLEQSVNDRLVSDVPIGTFLSGGIDSSLVTALAARNTKNLSTFSIGFKDEPLFDETHYALLVAKKYNTNHHVYSLDKQDLLSSLYETLDYIDEPFADSSALAVNALCKRTKNEVTVALSGDGADEMFAGYNKHMGEYLQRSKGIKQNIVKGLYPIWENLPKSRNSKFGNIIRKFNKFAQGSKLSEGERYWLWASLMNEETASNLMTKSPTPEIYQHRKSNHLNFFKGDKSDFNDVLATDMKLVLLSDMLRKVDLMSMANSLEVRTPFLDHKLVNFAFKLHSNYKIDSSQKKKIVQDAGRSLLPEELYNRPKQGFEVPLLHWFKTDLSNLINEDLLSDSFIKEQNVFNLQAIKQLKLKLNSSSPGDVQGNIWALIVFNSWWKRYIA